MVEANPLQWPTNWPRTKKPIRSRFNTRFSKARNELLNELRLLGAKQIVLSSNIELRRDGLPYAKKSQPEDKGVAVYFYRENKEQCIPCDKWHKVEDNIQAIKKTIEALRGLERWGAKSMVDAAFRGFQSLPHYCEGDSFETNMHISPPKKYFYDCNNLEQLKKRYKSMIKEMHPDTGGDNDKFIEFKRQYEEIKKNYI